MDLVDYPTVFHMPINGRVARRKRVSHVGSRDRVLCRSRDMSRVLTHDWTFPGSRGVPGSLGTCVLSRDTFSGSRATRVSIWA